MIKGKGIQWFLDWHEREDIKGDQEECRGILAGRKCGWVGGVQSVFKYQVKSLPCVKLVAPDLPLLEPDLLDNSHQQGVHVVVQGCAHLHILAVIGCGQGSCLCKRIGYWVLVCS